MSGFLLDTNIPSELTRPNPQESVSQWLDNADDEQLYLSVISLGEILKGITILPTSKRRTELQQWLDGTLRPGSETEYFELMNRLRRDSLSSVKAFLFYLGVPRGDISLFRGNAARLCKQTS
jgi:predicted nucleic acid-binding protein